MARRSVQRRIEATGGVTPQSREMQRKRKREEDRLLSNLKKISRAGLQDKCVIRIPDIKNFTTGEDMERSVNYVRNLGFGNIDCFTYKVNVNEKNLV